MSARLWTIETRRNGTVWLVPVLVAMSWLLVGENLRLQIALWVETSREVAHSVIFAGPFVGGAAAWMAGRDRRRGMEELLGTTPRPAVARDLALWAATATWGAVAYGLIAAYVGVLTARKATWDGPYGWPLLAGLLAILANASVGYAVGRFLPNRFTAPLVAIALFFGQIYLAWIVPNDRSSALASLHETLSPARFLSPIADVNASVWYGIQPNVAPEQVLWLAGLTAVGLALVALRGQRTAVTWVAFAVALLLAIGGGARTIASTPEDHYYGSESTVRLLREANAAPTPADLVCGDGAFTVCVHPAFEPWLDDIAGEVNRVTAPLVGLPGVPSRAEQAPFVGYGGFYPQSQTAVAFDIFGSQSRPRLAVDMILGCIVADCSRQDAGPNASHGESATAAIYRWLRQQAKGAPLDYSDWVSIDWETGRPSSAPDPVNEAAMRFARLTPAEQRAWLEANIVALRAGELTLEDLP